jgi:hypothetical protein
MVMARVIRDLRFILILLRARVFDLSMGAIPGSLGRLVQMLAP